MKAKLVLLSTMVWASSCITIPWESSGTFIAADDFNGFENLQSAKIEGHGCRYSSLILLFFGVGTASLPYAYADALAQSPPGTQGLSDVEIHETEFVTFIFNRKCVIISGVPAKKKQG